eukprot:11174341-Lingulodinium_polyedra.AAC.1
MRICLCCWLRLGVAALAAGGRPGLYRRQRAPAAGGLAFALALALVINSALTCLADGARLSRCDGLARPALPKRGH